MWGGHDTSAHERVRSWRVRHMHGCFRGGVGIMYENVSRCTYKGVMSPVYMFQGRRGRTLSKASVIARACMSDVIHMEESWNTYGGVIDYTYRKPMPQIRIIEMCHTRLQQRRIVTLHIRKTDHVAQKKNSWYTYGGVVSHI